MSGVGDVAERLLDDQRIHEQLGLATRKLRSAGGRAQKKGGRAVSDERLLDEVGTALLAFSNAAARTLGRPEPEPERVGGLGSLVILGVGVALLVEGLRGR